MLRASAESRRKALLERRRSLQTNSPPGSRLLVVFACVSSCFAKQRSGAPEYSITLQGACPRQFGVGSSGSEPELVFTYVKTNSGSDPEFPTAVVLRSRPSRHLPARVPAA